MSYNNMQDDEMVRTVFEEASKCHEVLKQKFDEYIWYDCLKTKHRQK